MRVRKHRNSNGTILVTLSTLKDFNNKAVNLALKDKEYKEFKELNLSKLNDDFIEDISRRFGFSITLNRLKEELKIKKLIA